MRTHQGAHPRMGAVDVIPFVPLRNVTTEEAVALARRLGEWIGEQGVPVYYYQDAATRPERQSLPDVRRGEYEGLAAKLATEAGAPDAGPAVFNERSGASIVGVRFPLIAFNVNLATDRPVHRQAHRRGRALLQRRLPLRAGHGRRARGQGAGAGVHRPPAVREDPHPPGAGDRAVRSGPVRGGGDGVRTHRPGAAWTRSPRPSATTCRSTTSRPARSSRAGCCDPGTCPRDCRRRRCSRRASAGRPTGASRCRPGRPPWL